MMVVVSEPKYLVGTKFKTVGKHPKICTIVDILRTLNSKGELVQVRYVATHEFMGQIIRDFGVLETSIARGIFWDPRI